MVIFLKRSAFNNTLISLGQIIGKGLKEVPFGSVLGFKYPREPLPTPLTLILFFLNIILPTAKGLPKKHPILIELEGVANHGLTPFPSFGGFRVRCSVN